MTVATEEDFAWRDERTIALMSKGVSFAEAFSQAAVECACRIVEREQAREQTAERKKLRAELEARATPAQGPTLKASFGDPWQRRAAGDDLASRHRFPGLRSL